ncbi:MAG: fused MFS/spermidine synthase [Planctomycetes bacterium]|nr:fused MFS/spermidine synthase [Planctomycetota bacterium]
MNDRRPLGLIAFYAATVFVSAFLLFQIQPLISKVILPWFGGSPAVWTTCVLFFQVLLFAGYAYAHLMTAYLSPKWQAILHIGLMAVALLTLPITPGAQWKPADAGMPAWRIFALLAANVGLPFFLLSSTGPLVQAWFSRACKGRSPYRLYALSNVGSLLALLSYPFVVEPLLTTGTQDRLWTVGFCVFALVCSYLAAQLWHATRRGPSVGTLEPSVAELPVSAKRPTGRLRWFLYPAFASMMLLAVTNHACQDMAVIPFLWVVPLSLYLLSFIICFDNEKWYSRGSFAGLTAVVLVGISVVIMFGWQANLFVDVGWHFLALFLLCMICHGELVSAKPAPKYLTSFYLSSAAGGALGGVFVAVICPLIFSTYLELNLGMIGGGVLAMSILWREGRRRLFVQQPRWKWITAVGAVCVCVLVACTQFDIVRFGDLATYRNFYGVLYVEQEEDGRHMPGRALIHGTTAHGFQFRLPEMQHIPTAYYARNTGVGRTVLQVGHERPIRVGVVGLGCGTLAAYGRDGDYFRFYEINPDVVEIAHKYFTFIDRSHAKVDIVLRDARLALEHEPDQHFDLLVLDAFSSDAVPTHLLTREAFEVYLRHLKPGGVIAVHISNRHLNLRPVVSAVARKNHMRHVLIRNGFNRYRAIMAAQWMILTRDSRLFATPAFRGVISKRDSDHQQLVLWTDQFHNLLEILEF